MHCSYSSTLRRGAVVTVGAVAGLLVVASLAWACTVNMAGTISFTNLPTDDPDSTSITSASRGATVYSQASDLMSGDTDYVIHYVYASSPSDPSTAQTLCHNTSSILGARTFHTDAGGDWANQAVTLPAGPQGFYAMCASTVPAADGGGMNEVGNWSNHMTFTLL